MLKILIETGFLLALNPRDKHHEWALNILKEVKDGRGTLYISPIAPIEPSLIMRSKGHNGRDILRVLNALESIVRRYTKPYYPPLELRHIIYATDLRTRYSELTFFDSIHASIAILDNLTYYDLDETIKNIIDIEVKRKSNISLSP
ncbi:MAG: hypothetical protein DRO12_06615 [Thermoprotei archaeon]|nr:MAG: hypothetical protein DRO12_06615 [Thermoprotei archaeon]